MIASKLFIPRTVLAARYHRARCPATRPAHTPAPRGSSAGVPAFCWCSSAPTRIGASPSAWPYSSFIPGTSECSATSPPPRANPSRPSAWRSGSTAAPWSRWSTTSSRALGTPRRAGVAWSDALDQRGVAERRRDPVDRRAYTLYLTPAGRALLADLQRIAAEHEAELLTALDASERSRLISLLRRVAESQGLAAGVHPDLEPRAGADQSH